MLTLITLSELIDDEVQPFHGYLCINSQKITDEKDSFEHQPNLLTHKILNVINDDPIHSITLRGT